MRFFISLILVLLCTVRLSVAADTQYDVKGGFFEKNMVNKPYEGFFVGTTNRPRSMSDGVQNGVAVNPGSRGRLDSFAIDPARLRGLSQQYEEQQRGEQTQKPRPFQLVPSLAQPPSNQQSAPPPAKPEAAPSPTPTPEVKVTPPKTNNVEASRQGANDESVQRVLHAATQERNLDSRTGTIIPGSAAYNERILKEVNKQMQGGVSAGEGQTNKNRLDENKF